MIPIFELKRQYEALKPELDGVVHAVMEHGIYTLGERLKLFESEFADYIGVYHAIGVASGTDALTLALKTLDIRPGDEVVIPANAYPTAFGVALSGCRIRLADCGSDGNMDPEDLKKRITKKTKVVIPVHLYGNPADLLSIHRSISTRTQKIFILEDAAQAHGAQIDGKKVGTFGDIAIFSFYPSKNLGAYGDGGMVVTDSSKYHKRLTALRMYGETSRYHSEEISGVSRLDELQAAILSVKLKYLDGWNKRRVEIAQFYTEVLKHTGDINPLTIYHQPLTKSCHHLFVIRTKKRDELQKYLLDHGVGCGIHYPLPVHLTPSFKSLGYKKGDFPEAEAQSREVLSLPIFPDLTDGEAEEVVKTIQAFYRIK